jgi:acetyl-CoA synthetase
MDRPSVIHKLTSGIPVQPNWRDYDRGRSEFAWAVARKNLQGLPGGALNIGFEAVDRHAAGALRDHVALRFVARNTAAIDMSFVQLAQATNRFANVLKTLGVNKGDHLFVLAGRIPELYIAVLGALKNGTVVTPMFSAFGPEPISTRINIASGEVLVTTDALYKRKVKQIRQQMPSLRYVILVAEEGGCTDESGTLDWQQLMDRASDNFETVLTLPEDPALLHFTSGTTGTPKAAIHVHGAVVAHYATGYYALDLHAQDRYWCTADPGWVTGTSYGIMAPLLHGVTSLIDREEFDAERWYTLLEEEKITVWYTAPTAIRMLMKYGAELAQRHKRPALRFIASVGEPLNPEAVWWGQEVLGLPIHDNWWQTETGGIMIANTPAFDIKPGSMGRPVPGIEAMIVERIESEGESSGGQGNPHVRIIDTPNVEGELALKSGWPSMFRGYLNNESRYQKCFTDGLYLTGDLARRDADGYYWFVGRADDVIKSAGHLIGPFEVESVLMEHPAVAEAGVIGKPDPVVGEVVKAFVLLKNDFVENEPLRMAILGHARQRLGAAVAPKEIAFVSTMPRTRSGKIMRRLLKARELGLPEGDISTLESNQ